MTTHPQPAPEPSHVQQVLTTMADELERPSNRRRLLTEVGLRRAFTVAVAAKLHGLPTADVEQVSDEVTELLPDTGPVITHDEFARLLRKIAEELR